MRSSLRLQCTEAHGEQFLISDGACTFREFLAPLIGDLVDEMPSFSREELRRLEAASRPTFSDLARVLANDEVMRVLNGLPVAGNSEALHRAPLRTSICQGSERAARDARRCPAVASAGLAASFVAGRNLWAFPNEYSSDKARQILGWTPRVSLEEGQRASVAWLDYLGLRDERRELP